MAHLATGQPPPADWLEFVLMDRFHWTLPEVRAISLEDALRLFAMIGAEAKVARAKAGRV